MPELPDIIAYREALERLVVGQVMQRIHIVSPFVLRSVEVSPGQLEGQRIAATRRIGKRLVLVMQNHCCAVIHLMIAGRLNWGPRRAVLRDRQTLAGFDIGAGTLLFFEASKRKRASLHLVADEKALSTFDRGGVDVLECGAKAFAAALRRENHTLKRCLTDPRIFDGIGNAYSDEILHRARMSPFLLSQKLSDAQCGVLREAARVTLKEWIERLRHETGSGFPTRVTAFRPDMAVHGKHKKPCPDCGKPVQRIVYADNETNYCAVCQNAGRLLADRGLSRLLKADWPKTLEDLEELSARNKR